MRSIVYATHRSWKIQTNSTNWLKKLSNEIERKRKDGITVRIWVNHAFSFISLECFHIRSWSLVLHAPKSNVMIMHRSKLLPHSNDWTFFSLWFTFMYRIVVCVIFFSSVNHWLVEFVDLLAGNNIIVCQWQPSIIFKFDADYIVTTRKRAADHMFAGINHIVLHSKRL